MKLIKEERFDLKLKEREFNWNFEVEKEGIYGIEILASCKSWWQNFLKSFFKDDELFVKIDGISFSKKSVAWIGSNLKGLKKTNFFVIRLSSGTHNLNFLANQSPFLELIRIYQIEESEISFLPKDNFPIQDGNRRQWLTIVLVNLPIKALKIEASAEEGKKFFAFKKDDSDLKLIIDGEIQKNEEPKSHKNWYWCGRVLKGKEKVFERELNLKPEIHYMEFWADRSPKIKEIKIEISKEIFLPIFSLSDIQKYTFQGIKGNEDYNRFDSEILEAVNFWNKFFFSQKYPPPKPLDPNLVKAMIYVESRMGYFENGFPDVMQVWDERNPAVHSIKGEPGFPANEFISDEKIGHMSYSYPKEWLPPKVETPRESIFWGVRWLYHKAQKVYGEGENYDQPPFKREWKSWEEALIDYNGSEMKYEYQKNVLKIYYEGLDPNGNILFRKNSQGKIKIFLFFILGIIFSFILGIFSALLFWKFLSPNKVGCRFQIVKEIEFDRKTQIAVLEDIFSNKVGLAEIKKIKIPLFKNPKIKIKKFLPSGDFDSLNAEHFDRYGMGDFNKDGKKEIAFWFRKSGSSLVAPFYLYQEGGENFKLLLVLLDPVSETEFKDFNNDGIFEIEHAFSLDGTNAAGRNLTKWKEVWVWEGKEYKKGNNLYPEIYSDLVNFYDEKLKNYRDEQAKTFYKPTLECLLEKAKQNQKKIFADGRECFKKE